MPFYYRIEETRIAHAMVIETIVPAFARRVVLWVLCAAGAVCALLSLIPGITHVFPLALIAAGPAIGIFLFNLFVQNGLVGGWLSPQLHDAAADAKSEAPVNAGRYVTFPVARAIAKAGTVRDTRRILAELLQRPRINFIMGRMGLAKQELLQALRESSRGEQEDFLAVLTQAARHAVRYGHVRIGVGDMLRACADKEFVFRRFLFDHGYSSEDLDRVLHWEDRLWHRRERRRKFWLKENLFRMRGIGIDWAAGYTVLLNRYSRDLTRVISGGGWDLRIIGRADEIESMERALAKTGENNALMVGEPGVGRETIVYGFARRVLNGRSLAPLNRKRVVELDMQAVVSGLATPGDIEERLRRILVETVKARNIILVVTDLHNFIHAETGVGKIDISSALAAFIRTNAVQLVATTTYQGLHEHIEKNPEILRYFEKIEITPPSPDQVFAIIVDTLGVFEKRHHVVFLYPSLRAIIDLADRYIQDIPFPEKAIDLLGDVAILVSNERRKFVEPKDIAKVVAQRTQIPVGEVTREEREKLLNLEEFIHQRIVDQEEAVKAVSEALRRERAGVRVSTKKPIGTFLFLGPTGVGKTETAKALAEAYFGNEERMLRFDMSEFQKQDALDRLIGSPASKEEGRLTNAVREFPFSLLLLDELEKAHPKILDVFLQIFDEGEATDGWGRKVVFSNTIIIATSNAGAVLLRKKVQEGAGQNEIRRALVDFVLEQGIYRPEFLNRFDAVMLYRPLREEDVRQIAQIKLSNLARKLYDEKGIKLEVGDETLARLALLGFSEEFGARELNRVMQEKVEGALAKEILAGRLGRGDTFVLSSQMLA